MKLLMKKEWKLVVTPVPLLFLLLIVFLMRRRRPCRAIRIT